MSEKVTLKEHLEMVDQNSRASEKEIESLCERIRKKFRDCGYSNVWSAYSARGQKNEERRQHSRDLIRRYVEMILETQDYRCTHWLRVEDGELNGVWNRPGQAYCSWRVDHIIYEIDHVHPVNAGGLDDIKNFQFLSSNANQYIKSSMSYDDLLRRVDLAVALKGRIRNVLDNREKLFKSDEWREFIIELEECERAWV